MPDLIEPSTELYAAWLEAHNEWGLGAHEDGFGLTPSDDVRSDAGFRVWVERLIAESGPADATESRCVYRWIVENGQVLGGIALRHGDPELIRRVGNVGYGIRPSARGRGLAGWALGQILDEARRLGLQRVLLVCASDNVASAKTVERNNGVLESVELTEQGPVCRYWIDL